jgi:hypothetical protein
MKITNSCLKKRNCPHSKISNKMRKGRMNEEIIGNLFISCRNYSYFRLYWCVEYLLCWMLLVMGMRGLVMCLRLRSSGNVSVRWGGKSVMRGGLIINSFQYSDQQTPQLFCKPALTCIHYLPPTANLTLFHPLPQLRRIITAAKKPSVLWICGIDLKKPSSVTNLWNTFGSISRGETR